MNDFPPDVGVLQAIPVLLFMLVAWGLWLPVVAILSLPGVLACCFCRRHRVLLLLGGILLMGAGLVHLGWPGAPLAYLLANPFLPSGVILTIGGLVRMWLRPAAGGPPG